MAFSTHCDVIPIFCNPLHFFLISRLFLTTSNQTTVSYITIVNKNQLFNCRRCCGIGTRIYSQKVYQHFQNGLHFWFNCIYSLSARTTPAKPRCWWLISRCLYLAILEGITSFCPIHSATVFRSYPFTLVYWHCV